MSDILFKCPRCSEHFVIDSRDAGTSFSCANCNADVQVPAPSIVFRCSSCNAELSAPQHLTDESFACPGCEAPTSIPASTIDPGTPKTVQHRIPEEKPQSGLRLKREVHSAQEDNPIFHRFPKPTCHPVRRRHPILKVVGSLLTIGLAAGAALYFVDLGDITEMNHWGNATQTLHILKERPGASDALKDMRGTIVRIEETKRNRNARCWLMTVYALGQLGAGNRDEGIKCCKHVREAYPDTDCSEMLADNNLFDDCSKGAEQCATCKGSGKCASCGGSGKRESGSAPTKPSRKGLSRVPSATRTKRIGGSLGKPQRAYTSQKCLSCKGTGQCMRCKGSADASSGACKLCGGTGQAIAKIRVKEHYDEAIEKALLHALPGRAKEKTFRFLAGVQSKIKSRIQDTSSTEDSAAEVPLEQVLSNQRGPEDVNTPSNTVSNVRR